MPARLEIFCELDDGMLTHAVHQTVGAGIAQDRRHDVIRPVVIVRKAAQGGLQSAEINRDIGERPTRQLGIDRNRAVGTLSAHAARGVGVIMPALFGYRIVGNHRVDVAAVDEDGIARPSHREEIRLRAEVRLGQDCDAEAGVLQHTGDDRRAERRMIQIRIAGHQQEVAVIPAARDHIFFGNRQKAGIILTHIHTLSKYRN